MEGRREREEMAVEERGGEVFLSSLTHHTNMHLIELHPKSKLYMSKPNKPQSTLNTKCLNT